ncbi:MAG: hypothetical protein GY705_12355 [Bacteroidetes bacterium]|nr:hypothetical protein [Bacteroidota bacterium]
MKNIYMFLIVLFIFISCSNACAANFQSDLEIANPIGDLETHGQWRRDDASTKPCASAHRDYNFCLNKHNKYNLGYDCYKEKMALKNCWGDHWAGVNRNCQISKNNYFFNIDNGNFQLANSILEGANGCDWHKQEKQKIKDYYCNEGAGKFNKAFSPPLDEFLCKQILQENTGCLWHEKASWALYNAIKTPDFPSVANSRPTYSTDDGIGHCPKQHSSREKIIDTNGIPTDKTRTVCTYFGDGALESESPYIDAINKDGKHIALEHGVHIRYWTFSGTPKHPLSRKTTYRNGKKHGILSTYSWCPKGNTKIAYHATDYYYDEGKKNHNKTITYKSPCSK